MAYAAIGLFVMVRLLDDFVLMPMTIGRNLKLHPLLTVVMATVSLRDRRWSVCMNAERKKLLGVRAFVLQKRSMASPSIVIPRAASIPCCASLARRAPAG